MAFINDVVINISRGTMGLTGVSFTPLIVGSGSVASGVVTIGALTDLTAAGYTSADAEYDMAAAMLSQSPAPSEIKVMRKLTATDYDDALDALILTDSDFWAVCIASREKADLALAGTWANANKKFFFGGSDDITALTDRNVDREAYLIHDNEDTDYPECAWVGKVLPKNAGSATWKWKVLNGQNASEFTSTELNTIRTNNGNALQEQNGATFVNEGITTSGEYIDIIQGQDWIESEIKIGLISLATKNDKIPFDDTGIAMIEGVVRDVLKRAGDNGIIARAISDADKEKSDDKYYMYLVTTVSRADTSTNDRANREYNGLKFIYTTAGAIHEATVTGYIEV